MVGLKRVKASPRFVAVGLCFGNYGAICIYSVLFLQVLIVNHSQHLMCRSPNSKHYTLSYYFLYDKCTYLNTIMVLVRAEINLHSHVGRAIPTITMRLITASGVTPPIGLQLPTPEQLTTIVSGLTRHSFTLFTLFSSLSRSLITPPPRPGTCRCRQVRSAPSPTMRGSASAR